MLKNLFIRENLKWKEVKKMKKLILFAILGIMLSIGTAQADFWTGDLWNPTAGFVPGVQTFDWSSSGSGVAVGLGPFGTIVPAGTPFDFKYQAFLVGVTDSGGNPIALPGLNVNHEYTVAANLNDMVIAMIPLGPLVQGLFQTVGGTFDIYYDAPGGGTQATVATGRGFDDGILVASGFIPFDPVGNFATFTANLANGTGIGSTLIEGLITYANPAYLDLASIIFDFRYEGTLNYPPLDSTTTHFFSNLPGGDINYPIYAVTGNDLLLKVDGSSKFSVPEPATLILLGSGLLGLGGLARKRKKN